MLSLLHVVVYVEFGTGKDLNTRTRVHSLSSLFL